MTTILLKQYGNVKDQGPYGTCYENAMTSSIEHLLRQGGVNIPDLSRMQSYYDTRVIQDTVNTDSGSIGYITLYAAMTTGLAPEYMWNYSPSHMYAEPTEEVYLYAKNIHITTYTGIYKGPTAELMRDQAIEYLKEGKSIISAFTVKPWFQAGTTGGHAVEIVGWNDNTSSYIIKNSWGTDWGNKGYGEINYVDMYNEYISMHVVTGMSVGGTNINFNWTPNKEFVGERYSTILGRAAEIDGMSYWENNGNTTHKGALSNELINSAEGKLIYGNLDNSSFVDAVYSTVLGREADVGGLNFWSSALDDGYSRGFVFDSFLESVHSSTGEAHEMLENKTNLSLYITVALQYKGGEDDAIKMEMASVTADDNLLEIIKIGIPADWAAN